MSYRNSVCDKNLTVSQAELTAIKRSKRRGGLIMVLIASTIAFPKFLPVHRTSIKVESRASGKLRLCSCPGRLLKHCSNVRLQTAGAQLQKPPSITSSECVRSRASDQDFEDDGD